MTQGTRVFAGRIRPRLDYFEHKEAVAPDEPQVRDPAIRICETLGNERHLDLLAGQWCEAEGIELVYAPTRSVAAADHLRCEVDCWNLDRALACCHKGDKTIIAATDNAAEISGGSNSIIVCQHRVMRLAMPRCAVAGSSTGLGSSRP